MLYLDTINVGGTEYGVTSRKSAYPIACQLGADGSSGVTVPAALDADVAFGGMHESGLSVGWMRTGQSGAYEYQLVLLVNRDAPNTYTFEAPTVIGAE